MNSEQSALINTALQTCMKICGTKFHECEPMWLTEAIFVKLLIDLKDALFALDALERRVSFSDDLPNGIDVTEQVRVFRNAACHLPSGRRVMDERNNRLHLAIQIGKGELFQSDTFTPSNPYDDDTAFFYGCNRLFLRRHIHRAILEGWSTGHRLAVEHNHFWQSAAY